MTRALNTLAFLHAHGLDVEPKGLAAELRAAIERLTALYRTEPGQEGLTVAELAVAQAGGLSAQPRWSVDPLMRGVVAHATLVTTGLTASQAASRLGVSDARIRQRLGDGTLFGIREGRAWRLPLFQFTPVGELPGWSTVCAAIPASIAPVELDGWLSAPHPDLGVGDDEQATSPRSWLLEGRSAERVAALLGELV